MATQLDFLLFGHLNSKSTTLHYLPVVEKCVTASEFPEANQFALES